MVYNSFSFIVLFPFIFILYYAIPAKYGRARNLFLLVVSYLLYMTWRPAYALILLGVTALTYGVGRYLQEHDNKRALVCFGGVVTALSPLLFFKYFNFINEVIGGLLAFLGLRFYLPGLNWAIPVGISFFTFQALGYVFDVYRRKIEAERSFLVYALYISFFPSIVSGPINKASLMIPQLRQLRPYFDFQKAVDGLKLLLWGMFMKVVVADRIGLYVDTVYAAYQNYSGLTCFVASVLYSVQIYADFAGYSLMALAVGKLLGFDLTENFRRPYFAFSVTDFWHRWHISLSTWLKDYVYIPLGGSRCSKVRNYWNIFVTFLVSGIWHGANWTFIVWGAFHGVAQIIEKFFGLNRCNDGGWWKMLRVCVTFLFINFTWVFFRLPSISDGLSVISKVFSVDGGADLYLAGPRDAFFIVVGIIILFAKDLKDEYWPTGIYLLNSRVGFIRWSMYLFLIVTILLTGVFDAGQFIYANF